MSSGLVVDNVLVAADEKAALELQETAWRPKFDHIKKIADANAEKERAEERAADVPGFFARVAEKITDGLDFAADLLPEAGGAKDLAKSFVQNLGESVLGVFSFVALVATVFVLILTTLVGGKDEEEVKKTEKKKLSLIHI